MSDELKVRSGTKLQLAFDVPPGQEPEFNMISTFNKVLDESAFLISMPMKDGKPLYVSETQKLLLRYTMGGEPMIIAGYADDEVKDGIRRYLKIRRVTEQRVFFKRADERLKVALRITYLQDTWPLDEKGKIVPEDGMTLDISAGGMALFLNRVFDVGEVCQVTLPRVGVNEEGRAVQDIVSAVCWNREAPKGSLYRHICGLQFRLDEGAEKQQLRDYVENVKKKYKL